ncbi:GAF domain-containing protein, partial [bacterium]|nr:GAF domain-containing protein [bacterium]
VFGEAEKELLHRFGSHIAVAIENARLFEQLQFENTRQMDESQALQNVGISLSETFELAAVLDRVMQAALKLIQGDEGSILFFDDARDEFLPDALMSTGIGQPLQSYPTRVRQHKGLAYNIVKERKSVVISDIGLDSRVSKVSIEKGRRAMVGVPLISHEGPVGVLWVNWKNPRQLSDHEANILTALASQATVAIQGAKRYEEIQKNSRLRKALLEAGKEITSLQKLPDKLQSITDRVLQALNCDLVTLYTLDQSKNEIDYPLFHSGELYDKAALEALGFVSKKSIVWKILESGKAHFTDDAARDKWMILADADRHEGIEPFVLREKIISSGAIPLIIGKGKVGILFVNYRSVHHFSEQEKNDIRIFAAQAAMA